MKRTRRTGMTLMELVIGLAITGIMAAAGASAFASIIDHKRVIREASVTTERAAALRETVRSWALSGTVRMVIGGGPRGLTSTGGRGGRGAAGATGASGATNNPFSIAAVTPAQAIGDELTIGNVTAVNPTFQPGVTIRLYIDGDANTPEHGLTMEYRPISQTQALVRRMLDSTLDSLRVEYLDGRTGRWMASSQAATINNPRAIRVTFVPNPKIPYSPILLEPLIFSTGLEVQNFNRPSGR